jgi:phage/plasmid-like protein (TIGR03299 family)
MSHNLLIQNGEASMMYVGGLPWHGLGTRLAGPATAKEAIQAAHLDWQVRKLPLCAVDGLLHLPVKDKFGVARDGSLDVLGVVGRDYTPVQNREAFAFFDPIVGKNAAIYHTAGALGKGERVWILAKLPDSIRVVGDDITERFLLLTNSHDGKSSLQVKFTPVRVVCQNTLTLALNQGGGNGGIKLAHQTDIHRRLQEAERMLGIVRYQFDTLAETFREMVRVPMDSERLKQYLRHVFPASAEAEDDADCVLSPVSRDRAWSEYFFDQGAGNRMAGVKGTLWAAYNGVTEWLDHRKTRQNPAQRLTSIWFGETNRTKTRALTAAMELLPQWRN